MPIPSKGEFGMMIQDDDQAQYDKIAKMSVWELLVYVVDNPNFLTDSYYKGYDKAIYDRVNQLEPENETRS